MSDYTFSKAKGEHLSLDFHDYDYWESVDDILVLLKQLYDVKILKELDGPATRYRKIEVDGNVLTLHYTSYGSFMSSEDKNGDDFLRKIKVEFESIN